MKINWMGAMVILFLICGLFAIAIYDIAREVLQENAMRRKRLGARFRG